MNIINKIFLEKLPKKYIIKVALDDLNEPFMLVLNIKYIKYDFKNRELIIQVEK